MSIFARHGDAMEPGMDMGTGDAAQGVGTSSDGHGGMDGMAGMSGMSMLFQTNLATPLYVSKWTPNSAGAYAGTCIFLVVLAILTRVLLAVKARMEARWQEHESHRVYNSSNGDSPLVRGMGRDVEARKTMSLSDNGVEETVMVVERRQTGVAPWRLTVDPVRAILDVIIVGVGYMLMLAVMTMNVGYFFSVLAGVFVGSLAVGRFSKLDH
ncbi:putative copper transporter crmD [Paramyrothecium foliicola]|nr:putative copper transporter crmD [Paramyrothecium foliicola]